MPPRWRPTQFLYKHKRYVQNNGHRMHARRNFTKFIGILAARQFGRESGPRWRNIYSPLVGRVPAVVDGVTMPWSVDDVEEMTDHELAVTLRACGVCSHAPTDGGAYHRYQMQAMIFVIVGALVPANFFPRIAFPQAANQDVTARQAVEDNFPAPYED
ncbi:hypothetical protein BJ508DRAFT_315237 [Ascobolus immersus RN42]|uniref:Uncharacterized protein n=1 Tax=Ascobolus immersus RN42 TaxID=1160509 RepID=A0A3N4HFA7_ASCIM|nr:hypothetical protein BJ508DRAFT_315237 [Ascobolus immersus RN42]